MRAKCVCVQKHLSFNIHNELVVLIVMKQDRSLQFLSYSNGILRSWRLSI